MSLCKSKAQKRAKSAQKNTESKVVDAGSWLSHEIGELGVKLQQGVESGAAALASGVEASRPYVQEGLDRAQDLGQTVKAKGGQVAKDIQSGDLATKASKNASKASKQAAKRADKNKAAAQDKYHGVMAALAGKVATTDTPDQLDALVAKLTGDKKAVKRVQKAAKQAAKKQRRAQSGNKGLLVLGLLVAGGVAGVAAWRASRPVQDPWKTPATTSPHVSASPVSGGTTVAAGAGVKVDDVQDPTAPVNNQGAASQAAHRASEGAKSVAQDAKQTLNEVKEQIKGSKDENDTK